MAATTKTIQPARPGNNVMAALKRRIPYWVLALLRNPISVVGTVIVLTFAIIALLAPALAPPADPTHPYQIPRDGYLAEPQPAAPGHPFGTTEGQHDIFYGVIWGTRTAFQVGIIITLLAVLIGGALLLFVLGWNLIGDAFRYALDPKLRGTR